MAQPQTPDATKKEALIKTNVNTVRGMLEKSRAQLTAQIPKHLSIDRFLRVALTSIARNPTLGECTPLSLVGGVIQAAQLGLELDGTLGHAYLVPYWNNKKGVFEAQFQTGYRGYMDLAFRSDKVSKIEAHAVYANDKFSYAYGLHPSLEHEPARGNRGALTATYALAVLKDGERQFWVCELVDIQAARQRSKAKDSGPWVTDYDAMAIKTAVRRLAKFIPLSPEMARATGLDDQAEADIPQGLEILTPDYRVEDDKPEPREPAKPPVQQPARVDVDTKTGEVKEDAATPEQRTPVGEGEGKPATAADAPAAEFLSPAEIRRVKATMRDVRKDDELMPYLATLGITDVNAIPRAKLDAVMAWAGGKD